MRQISEKTIFKLSIIFIIIISILLLSKLWQFDMLTLNIPISYYGGDDFGTLKNAKSIIDTGWVMENNYLGAPFGATYYEYPVTATLNFDNFLLKLLLFITKDIASAVNLQFIIFFPIISVISYSVMKSLKINNTISIVSSLAYAFMPYIFLRGMSHTVLSAYQFIPLSILLCIWLYTDDDFFSINRNFIKYKRNILAIFFTILIANNGIAYYPFFTCFLFIVTGFIKATSEKNVKYLFKSISLIICIVVFFILALMPIIIFKLSNTDSVSTYRSRIEAEIYGLKIIQLYLPVNSHGIELLDKLIRYYNTNAPLVNENNSSYLGIPGIFGFTFLIITLFINNIKMDKIYLLSKLNISAVLLGTIGGFGSMVAILIVPMIRSYNRISIFIAYISLLALAIVLDYIVEKTNKKRFYYIVIVIVFGFSILEQFPGNVPNYEYVKTAYMSDKEFVKSIESMVSDNAMIYQLPYHAYPESGPVNGMNDYHLLSPYLHSNGLRWSYGASKGSKSDLWNKKVANMSVDDMIKTISIAGFEGIYIDKRAYNEPDYNSLENKLIEVLNKQPIYSDTNQLAFFSMTEYNKKYRELYSADGFKSARDYILNFVDVQLGKGFTAIEGEEPNQWIWLSNNSELLVYNYSLSDEEINISFKINSGYDEDSDLTIYVNDKVYNYQVNSKGTSVNIDIKSYSGKNTIRFETNAKRVVAPGDPRELYLRITDFNIDYKELNLK